jgi:hypothetical protein
MQSQLTFVGMSDEFIGAEHGGIGVSFFLVIGGPGRGAAASQTQLREDRLCDRRTREVDWESLVMRTGTPRPVTVIVCTAGLYSKKDSRPKSRQRVRAAVRA